MDIAYDGGIFMKTRIEALRHSRGIKQSTLARYVNTTQQTISRIENGWTVPSAEMIVDIARYFNVSTDYLLCLTDNKRIYDNEFTANRDMRIFAEVVALYSSLNEDNRGTVDLILRRLSEVQGRDAVDESRQNPDNH